MQDMRNMGGQHNMRSTQLDQQKKSKKNIIIGAIVLLLIVGIIWWVMGSRGSWKCEDGQWVMNGKTDAPMPETMCGDGNDVDALLDERVKPDAEMIELDSKKVAEGIDIRVKSPHVNQTVVSPLKIEGEAKGWYFEGSFPVQLYGENGDLLGSGTATADGNWAVDEYVPFNAEIVFDMGTARAGDIVFQKSNPSDKPENAGTFSFPVFFE